MLKGINYISSNNLELDVSGLSNGYIKARVIKPLKKRYKLRVMKSMTYDYDLNNEGKYEVIPLQMGDGAYEVALYRNVKSNKYATDGSMTVNMCLSRANSPYLCPNQMINYTDCHEIINKALTFFHDDPGVMIRRTKNFIETFSYDYIKAILTKVGQLPDIEKCFASKMGICQDLAALTVAMLRVNGIPAKMIIGYAGRKYHAWVEYWQNEKWNRYDPTKMIIRSRKDEEYSTERWY